MNQPQTFTIELTQHEIQALNDAVVTTWQEGKVKNPLFATALITVQSKFEQVAQATQQEVESPAKPGSDKENGEKELVGNVASEDRI